MPFHSAFEWAASFHPLPSLLLIVLGFFLLFLEIFVVSFGILMVSGLLCIIFGVALLREGGVFASPLEAQIAVATAVEWVLAAVILLTAFLIAWLVMRTQIRNRRLYGDARQRLGPDSGEPPEAVRLANALSPIRHDKTGKILYKGTYWSAKLGGGPDVQADELVRILDWDGMKALVERHDDKSSQSRSFTGTLPTHKTNEEPEI